MRLVLSFLTALVFCISPSLAQPEKLVDEWVEKDLAAIKLIRVLVDGRIADPVKLSRVLTNQQRDFYPRSQAVGFGSSAIEHSQGYGYSSIDVEALIHRESLIRYKVRFRSSRWRSLQNRIIGTWKRDVMLPFTKVKDGLSYEFNDEAALKTYTSEIARELGRQQDISVPQELRLDYQYLMSPFENSTVGVDGCGVAGVLPIGKAAIDRLVRARRYGLIGNVLRGYNPGGRVYALMELTKLRNAGAILDPSILESMRKVTELEIQLHMCNGGTIWQRSAAEILKELM